MKKVIISEVLKSEKRIIEIGTIYCDETGWDKTSLTYRILHLNPCTIYQKSSSWITVGLITASDLSSLLMGEQIQHMKLSEEEEIELKKYWDISEKKINEE